MHSRVGLPCTVRQLRRLFGVAFRGSRASKRSVSARNTWSSLPGRWPTMVNAMVAPRGAGLAPRLFLLGATCASTLLSSAVGITITASLYHSTLHAFRTPQRTHRNATGFARTAVASARYTALITARVLSSQTERDSFCWIGDE